MLGLKVRKEHRSCGETQKTHTAILCYVFHIGMQCSVFLIGMWRSVFHIGMWRSVFRIGMWRSVFRIGMSCHVFRIGMWRSVFRIGMWCSVFHNAKQQPALDGFFIPVPAGSCPIPARIFQGLSRSRLHNPTGRCLRWMDSSVPLLPAPMIMCHAYKTTNLALVCVKQWVISQHE